MCANANEEAKPPKQNVWNSLEITKIVVSSLTPLAIAFLSFVVSSADAEQARVDRVLERRLATWNSVGPKIRQMRDEAAFIYQGSNPRVPESQRNRTIGSGGIIRLIHEVDGTLDVSPFFTPAVKEKYLQFSYCALDLAQSAERTTQQQLRPPTESQLKNLGVLWTKTRERYLDLVTAVRIELSDASEAQRNTPNPTRNEASLCN